MKLSLLLVLTILPMVIISVFAEGELQIENDFFIITDKVKYYKGESIIIMGEVPQILEDKIFLTIRTQPNNTYVGMLETIVNSNKIFSYELVTDSPIITNTEFYIISANYGDRYTETIFEYFDEPVPFNIITVITNKSEFNKNENVIVSGSISGVDWNKDTTIYYDVVNSDGTILESNSYDVLQNDETFNFILNTESWTNFGFTSINVTIQNSTTSTVFYYSDNPDSSNETLYDMISSQDLRITNNEDMIVQHDTLITEINNSTIHNIQEQLSSLSLDQSSMAQEITGIKNSMGGSPPEESIHPEITNFAGNSIGNETINLSWEITGEPITSYNLIYRYEQSNWDSDDTIHVNATTYIMNNLENEDYEIKLSATNEHGTSKIAKLIINPVTVGFFTDTSTDFNTNNESTHYTVTEHTSIDDLYKLIESQNITISNQQDQIDAFLQGLTILAESMRDYHK